MIKDVSLYSQEKYVLRGSSYRVGRGMNTRNFFSILAFFTNSFILGHFFTHDKT